ncbi:MAG: hypothetical protein ACYTEX_26545 [Planctomycetota bacterium]|jgi:hypothetical protein
MRKIMCAAAILLAASGPAVGAVVISVSPGPGPNDVMISYASSEPNRVRMFALDIIIDEPVGECGPEYSIAEVNCVSNDYYLYPGSISIDADGNVIDWGSCRCSGSYPGTLDEPNKITIEMGSLYVGEANAPASSGDLVILSLGGCTDDGYVTISVSENVIRGGVVMEDPYEAVNVVFGDGTVPTNLPMCRCVTCWEPSACAGQPSGDGTCDGSIDLADLFALKAAFGKSAPWTGSECCSDYNHDQSVNLGDLFILKAGFGSSGYVLSTGSQVCP